MAYVAISNAHSLAQNRRLDAEYFSPAGIEATRIIEKFPRLTPLHRITERVTQGPNPRFSSTGIPCLNGKNIYFGTASAGEPNFVSRQEYERLRDYQLLENDLVITLKHATKIGRTWIIESTDNKLFTRNVGMIRLKSHSLVNHASLLFYLCSDYAQRILDRIATGGTSGQITLATSALKNLPIPIFHDSFQLVLDSYLMNYHIVLGKSQTKFRDAESLLLAELGLADWQPGHTLTFVRRYSEAAHARRLDAEHFQPKFQNMFNRLSGQVNLDRLGKLANVEKGIEVGGLAYTDTGCPFLRVSNLTRHGLVESNVNYITNELYHALQDNYEPKQGEILLSKDATPGSAFYLEHQIQGIISSGILRLQIINEILPHYFELVLNSIFVQLQIEQDAGGSVIIHWKPSEVRKTLIPRLSPEKEASIADLVQQSHAARREAKALLENAKRAVEIAIEENEDTAINSLQ